MRCQFCAGRPALAQETKAMPLVDSHPPRPELEAFALGRLDDHLCTAVEGHVRTCSDCQSIVEGVPADGFVSLLRTAQSTPDTSRGSADAQQTMINSAPGDPSGTCAWATPEP